MAHKELLITWLNDVYRVETALIPILENHAKDAKNHPDIQARNQQHIEETRRHAEGVRVGSSGWARALQPSRPGRVASRRACVRRFSGRRATASGVPQYSAGLTAACRSG